MNNLKKVIQFPNPPLITWFIFELVSFFGKGDIHKVGTAISLMALTVWAYLEVTSGINLFRKLLGGIVLFYIAFSLFSQLR